MSDTDTRVMTCPHGHTEERRRKKSGRWGNCPACRVTWSAAYYEANRDAVLTRHKAYSEANRAKRRVYDETYREALKALAYDDEVKRYKRAYNRAYHEANRERLNTVRRERRARSKEQKQHGSKEQT